MMSSIQALTTSKGANAIFAITNFWEYFMALGQHGAGRKEYDQILTIAAAAQKTAGLEHFILPTLCSGEKLAGKEYAVPHMDYKDIVKRRTRSKSPCTIWPRRRRFCGLAPSRVISGGGMQCGRLK